MQHSARFATQGQVVAAAGQPSHVVRKWVMRGLMPEPHRHGGGHARGTRNQWPLWAVERARWISEQLSQGTSCDHLAELVRHGLGVPSPPLLADDNELAHVQSEESEPPADSPMNMSNPHEPIILDTFNLAAAERLLCETALQRAGSIVGAAALLGVTRHALKRRITKLRIEWPGR